MPLFNIANKRIQQIKKTSFPSERALQDLFESNLETLLGVRFIASEFVTGEKHGGRIDTLGIDQNDRPTLIEYKWREDETIINQGLFYLDWLFDHKGDFEIATQKKLGKDIEVNWDNPRLILIAESFSKYDSYAVNRIGENIELKVYRLYDDGLFLIEDFLAPADVKVEPETKRRGKVLREKRKVVYSVEKFLIGKNPEIINLFQHFRKAILGLGDNIEEAPVKLYVAYKTARNFCEVEVQSKKLKVWLDIPFRELNDPKKIAQDFSKVGHWGTGATQVLINSIEEIEYAISLVRQSYERTI